jgi:hypothetical protein
MKSMTPHGITGLERVNLYVVPRLGMRRATLVAPFKNSCFSWDNMTLFYYNTKLQINYANDGAVQQTRMSPLRKTEKAHGYAYGILHQVHWQRCE